MKKIVRQNAVKALVLTAITVILITGCVSLDAGGDVEVGDPKGTWVASDGTTIKFNDGNFDMAINKISALKGTYTTGVNSFQISVAQVNYGHPDLAVPNLEKKWYTRAELQTRGATSSQLDKLFPTNEIKYIGGNTFKMLFFGATDTFTRR
jgi:hypothetical protein